MAQLVSGGFQYDNTTNSAPGWAAVSLLLPLGGLLAENAVIFPLDGLSADDGTGTVAGLVNYHWYLPLGERL